MGGKNAAIIFKDVDLDSIMPNIIRSSFLNQGEICLASSRVFVEKEIYEKFLEKFVNEARKLKVGDPFDKDTYVGALVSEDHLRKVSSYLEIAKKEGLQILCGGDDDFRKDLPKHCANGNFFPPTIMLCDDDKSPCMKDEIFGPIACVTQFEDENVLVQRVNNVQYGLSASVWTKDMKRMHRIAQEIRVGTVWCNCWLVRDLRMPFGGMKLSGIGREGTKDSREFYTEKKTICMNFN